MPDYSEFAANERRGWANSEIAEAYHNRFGALAEEAASELLSMAHVSRQTSILDLCCGAGGLAAAALARGAQVTGLDFSSHMVSVARRRAQGAKIIEGDAQSLPFDAQSFDVVLSNFGIQHTPDHGKAYAEVHRVLRTRGRFAMTCWDARSKEGAFGLMMSIIKQNADFSRPPPAQPGLFDLADRNAADRTLQEHGFRLQEHCILPLRWTLKDPAEFFESFLLGTVGVRMLIAGQPEDAVERISLAAAQEVKARWAAENGYLVQVPVAALVSEKTG